MLSILVYTTLRSCFSSGFVYFSLADSSSNHSPLCVRSCVAIVCDSLLTSRIEELRFLWIYPLSGVFQFSFTFINIVIPVFSCNLPDPRNES